MATANTGLSQALPWLNRLLEVTEEEQLVRDDRPTEINAVFVEAQSCLGQSARVVGPTVRVQRVVPELIVDLPVQRVGATLGHKLHLYRAFCARIGSEPRGRDRHLVHRTEPYRGEDEEAGSTAPEPLRVVVDAIERDVDRTTRQSVERAVPRVRARRRPRSE